MSGIHMYFSRLNPFIKIPIQFMHQTTCQWDVYNYYNAGLIKKGFEHCLFKSVTRTDLDGVPLTAQIGNSFFGS